MALIRISDLRARSDPTLLSRAKAVWSPTVGLGFGICKPTPSPGGLGWSYRQAATVWRGGKHIWVASVVIFTGLNNTTTSTNSTNTWVFSMYLNNMTIFFYCTVSKVYTGNMTENRRGRVPACCVTEPLRSSFVLPIVPWALRRRPSSRAHRRSRPHL